MSKERELLVRCRAAINIRYDQVMLIRLHHEIETLLGEIEELLAQPEQEPVAWMNESGSCFLSDGNKYSEHWIPLYTAPKREPLSEEEIKKLYGIDCTLMGNQDYIHGFRDAEKHHGIGGGE